MSKYLFEKEMAVSFTAQAGGEVVAPNDIVSARLYSESPTNAQIEDDSDSLGAAIEKVESWSAGDNDNEKLITFAGVTDSDPHSTTRYVRYYVVVSYILEAGGSTVRDVLPIAIWRIKAVGSRYGVTTTEVKQVESKLSSWDTGTFLADKIDDAEEAVETDVHIEGFLLEKVDWSDLHILVKLKAVELCCRDLSNDPNDMFAVKAAFYRDRYDKRLKTIPIRYDQNDDGVPEEAEESKNRSIVYVAR